MRKSILLAVVALLLLSPPAFARVTVVDVTKENRQEKELSFNLSILKMNDKMYSVQFDAPKTGKLEKFRSASLMLYEGEQILLSVPLKEHGDDGDENKNISVKFSLHKDLLEKCVLSLMCSDIMIHTRFDIRVSTFAPAPAS